MPNLIFCDTKTVTKYISRYLGRPVIALNRIDSYDGKMLLSIIIAMKTMLLLKMYPCCWIFISFAHPAHPGTSLQNDPLLWSLCQTPEQ